ncbi:MAG TPA: hypothetical protein VFS36_00560 [Chitinophagaceae bacterium]|nr:hypothetical protein [Chitinophagaceae bacterium]
MKRKYLERLAELEQQAKEEIRSLLSVKPEFVLFEPDPENEWTKDIYDEIPDFAFYSKHGFVDYAAIRVISKTDNGITVTGILKGDSYPDEVTITLHEMDSYHILALADYLLSENN